MFTHYPVEPIELKRITEGDGTRRYVTPENNAYPSVTTFLGNDPEKQKGLENWREKIGHDEANKITKRAADRGEEMHKAIERYIANEENPLRGCSPHPQMLFKKLRHELRNIDNVRGQEIPLYSDILQLAGTVDLIADYNGILSTIDFKTARKFKRKEWIDDFFLQTLSYSIMFQELYGLKPTQLVVIIADENSAKGYAYVANRKDYEQSLIMRLKEFRRRNNLCQN